MELDVLLQERLAAEEWMAVGMSMLGTLGLGVSSEETPGKAELGLTRVVRLAFCFAFLGAAILYGSRIANPSKKKSAASAGMAASIHGLQVALVSKLVTRAFINSGCIANLSSS